MRDNEFLYLTGNDDKLRAEVLKNISLEGLGLIKNSVTDPIYKFCVTYKIDNVRDFINFYYSNRNNISKKYCLDYFDGIIDLINLIIFKDGLKCADYLDKKLKLLKNNDLFPIIPYVEGEVPTIGNARNLTLKRLGFNNEEIKKIFKVVVCEDKELKIIDAINSCIDDFDFEKMNSDDEIFINKLYALSEYYKKLLTNNLCNNDENSISNEDTNLLVVNLYNKICLLDSELKKYKFELENIISSQLNEDIKTLNKNK